MTVAPVSCFAEELARLVGVLDWAIELQADADRFVRVFAAEPRDVPVDMARTATRVANAYVQMAWQLDAPTGIAELEPYRTRALGLVRHHIFMLDAYLDLAFNSTLRRCRSDPHAAAHGLDHPAAELRALRLDVRAVQRRGDPT